MTNRFARARTLWGLGPLNLAQVLAYRLALKAGVHPVQRLVGPDIPAGPFFAPSSQSDRPAHPREQWRNEGLSFGCHRYPIGDTPPDWFSDPVSGAGSRTDPRVLSNWWSVPDFGEHDIKLTWELSRFDWALAFAQHVRTGEPSAAIRLERWTADWVHSNPPYRGANWKCAQEASIRLLHLALTARLLASEKLITPAMQALIEAHVRRIRPTLAYARAQDNNHATSEAAALFVAGAWFHLAGLPAGAAWIREGRKLLERAVGRLFADDGSFSQYSVTYHRLALDTLSLAETWRRAARLDPFANRIIQRARAATEWLRAMVDPESGDAPNVGANDGANLLPLTDTDYRDFRPSVQLASALFLNARAYPPGPWDAQLDWLGVARPTVCSAPPDRMVFDDGGYAVLRHGGSFAVLRYPRFRFRPSQCDALHVDFWSAGSNLLRDGGSYGYNTDASWIDYFNGVRSHNTIEFDDAPQMPRLSRFLLGDWLETEERGLEPSGFAAQYRHLLGWTHRRHIALSDSLVVTDRIDGFRNSAVLRWRLLPGDWRLDGQGATLGQHRLTVTADMPIVAMSIERGWESRYYQRRTELPVLEVRFANPGTIVSEFRRSS